MKKFSLSILLTLSMSSVIAGEVKMKHTLKDEVVLNSKSKVVRVLSNPAFKLIGLGLKTGQVLEKHTTPTPAVLIVQFGSVEFKMSGNSHLLKSGDYFEIPANVEHEVAAKEDSHLYLVK